MLRAMRLTSLMTGIRLPSREHRRGFGVDCAHGLPCSWEGSMRPVSLPNVYCLDGFGEARTARVVFQSSERSGEWELRR